MAKSKVFGGSISCVKDAVIKTQYKRNYVTLQECKYIYYIIYICTCIRVCNKV